jgi:serine protease AprX
MLRRCFLAFLALFPLLVDGQSGEFPAAEVSTTPVSVSLSGTGEASSKRAHTTQIDAEIARLVEASQEEVPLLVVLRSQPQRQILRQHETQAAAEVRELESRHVELIRSGGADQTKMKEARDRLEAALMALRKAAFDEIRAQIQPEQDSVAGLITQLGGRVVHRYTAVNMLAARVPAQAIQALREHADVARVALDEKSVVQLATSVPSLGVSSFWSAGFRGNGESVAVMDSGLKADHPAFQGLPIVNRVFLNGASADPCFADNSNSPVDLQGHGTHVAGIVASRGAPGWSTFLGVAPALGTLYNLKVGYRDCSGRGGIFLSGVVAAFDWAVENAPLLKVFNYSAGTPVNVDDHFTAQMFDFLADAYDLTLVVSAGNESRSGFAGLWLEPGPVSSPGIGYNVISVASMNTRGTVTRTDDEVSIFSSRGPTKGGRKKPDIAAAGGFDEEWTLSGWKSVNGIWSAAHDSNGFVPMNGTSMAAPHIAGAASLLRQAGVTDSLALKALLLNTTDTFGWDPDRGWGYANLTRAFAQRANVVKGAISRGRVRLLRGAANGQFYATLAWNRMVDERLTQTCLSNLDLSLYNAVTGSLVSLSNSSLDNVEQVAASITGDVVLNVAHFPEASCRESERFGLALSHGNFRDAAGVVFDLSCNVPSQVSPGSQFSVSCSVRNTGDLPGLAVNGQLGLSGSANPSPQAFGTILPGSSTTRTWTITASSIPGSYSLNFTVDSTAFGARFQRSSSFSFSVVSSTSCTVSVSPTVLDVAAANTSVSVSVTAPSGCSWMATSGVSWISFLGSTQGSGSGSVSLLITANPTSAPRTGSISIGGQTITIRQAGQIAAPRLTRILPQLAFGVSPTLGNWNTDLYLHNMTGAPAQAIVSFYADNGSPLSVPKWGPVATLNLSARGVAVVDVNSSGPLQQGSMHLEIPEGVVGYAIFRQSSPGVNPQEGVVSLAASSSSRSTVLFDETSFVTAVAVANPGLAPVTVQVVARDDQGSQIGAATLSLTARQRMAFVLRDRPEFRGIVGRKGTVDFSVSTGSISVLGLRFNGLAFTSISPFEQ